jgi:hypothetical protein
LPNFHPLPEAIMIHPSKSVLAVTATIVAAGLITLMSPKTVHAVAAALVEVTNTASNPVVTQSTSQQATQLVHMNCNIPTSADARGNGSILCGFVPSNQSLVVSAVDIALRNDLDFCVTGRTYAENLQVAGSGAVTYTWTLTFDGVTFGPTTHFIYPSGIVFPPNSTVEAAEGGGCPANFEITGYLTNN